MINNYIVFRDYETGSKIPTNTQPTQLAAIIIDMQRFELVENSTFESKIRPILNDEKAIEAGVAPIEEEALQITHLTREELAEAPKVEFVWQQYQKYLKRYNAKGENGKKWDAPTVAGFNNIFFDDVIDKRLASKYGGLDDDGRWNFYHPINNYDLHLLVRAFFHRENLTTNGRSYSMDACREYFGYDKEKAHNALCDVVQGADLLLRLLKLTKSMIDGTLVVRPGKKIRFRNCVTKKHNEYLNGIIG